MAGYQSIATAPQKVPVKYNTTTRASYPGQPAHCGQAKQKEIRKSGGRKSFIYLY